MLGADEGFFAALVPGAIASLAEAFPELPAQQKLVTIYINRAMEKNGGGGGKVAAKAGAMSVGDASRRPLAPRHQ